MIVGGKHFDDWSDAFPGGLLSGVFRLLAEQWPLFARGTARPLENRITNRFIAHLHVAMRRMRKPFHFDCRPKIPRAESDTELGEPDIKVQAGRRADVFLTIECKRLNVGYGDNADEYAGSDGMGCFIDGKYMTNPESGGMLGYVMDDRVDAARTAINGQLRRKRAPLCLKPPAELTPASFADEGTPVLTTVHGLAGGPDFTIYHLLLPYSGCASDE